MTEILSNFENYILNENNMINYLKYKITTNSKEDFNNNNRLKENNNRLKENNNRLKENNNRLKENDKKQTIFYPKENDSLFWCYFIIKNGEIKYETLNNKNIVITKQLKIDLINKIRDNKSIVKTYKFDTISNIENNIVNDNYINIKSIMTLCAIEKINLIFISKKTYFELLMCDNKPIYIIREKLLHNNYTKNYGFELANNDTIEEIRNTLYKIDNLYKPIKIISSYKLQDLIDICDKLAIEIINKDTNKKKTKNELYETIIQYF
jgi:hypothetical protein